MKYRTILVVEFVAHDFSGEIEMDLPFVPFVGLEIITERMDPSDWELPYAVVVEDVTWDPEDTEFSCLCTPREAIEGVDRPIDLLPMLTNIEPEP